MPKTNHSRFAVLGLLTLEPMSGYDIKKMVDTSLRHFWSESYGRVYPTLRELEADGFVTARKERQGRGPERIVYKITKAGLEILREWMVEPSSLPRVRSDLLLKIFFGRNVPIEASIEQIRCQRGRLVEVSKTFASYRRMITGSGLDGSWQLFMLLTLRSGELVTRARIRWCDEALKSLAAQTRRPAGAAK